MRDAPREELQLADDGLQLDRVAEPESHGRQDSGLLLVQPILPDYYTHYYKNACLKYVHLLP